MIEPDEATERARQLVKQFIAQAGPEEPEDYILLLTRLAAVVGFTLAKGAGPHEAVRRMTDVANDIARDYRIAGQSAPNPPGWKH